MTGFSSEQSLQSSQLLELKARELARIIGKMNEIAVLFDASVTVNIKTSFAEVSRTIKLTNVFLLDSDP